MSRPAKPKGRSGKRRRGRSPVLGVVVLGLVLLGVWLIVRQPPSSPAGSPSASGGQRTVTFPHMHGMGFSADGHQLIVAAHDGVRTFADGRWSVPPIPVNDYMGYSPVDVGFYSSGHPQRADLVNPLGLIKSTDGGQTFTTLGFAGESDFHIMGVGYTSHAIYVVNPAPNQRLAAGLHTSRDDGATWTPGAMRGVGGQPTQLAVHPSDPAIVALSTTTGVFLSADHGDTFAPVDGAEPVAAITFSPDGQRLYLGSHILAVYDWAQQRLTPVPMPMLESNDAVALIAINPRQPMDLALATHNRDIYRSTDGGAAWLPLARRGQGQPGS